MTIIAKSGKDGGKILLNKAVVNLLKAIVFVVVLFLIVFINSAKPFNQFIFFCLGNEVI